MWDKVTEGIDFLTSWLPTATLPSYFVYAFTSILDYLYTLDFILPVTETLVVLGIMATFFISIFVIKVAIFVYRLVVPFK